MTDVPSSPQPRRPPTEAPNTTELRRRDAELTKQQASQDARRNELLWELQQLDQERAKTAEVKSHNDEQLSARESAREVARDADDVAPAKGDEVAGGNDVLPVDNDDDAFGTDFGLFCARAAPAWARRVLLCVWSGDDA